MNDLLSDILENLSFEGVFYFRTSFRPPWGVRIPRHRNVARFHFVHRGECLIRHEGGGDPLRLAQGDLVIVPAGAGHALYCQPETEPAALPLETVLERAGFDGTGVLYYPGDDRIEDRETQLICGHFATAEGHAHPIFDRLPPFIHIPDYGAEAGQWMEASLRMIAAETTGGGPGSGVVVRKLSEIIFVQAIRAFLTAPEAEAAGLAGFSDKSLVRALSAIHADPATGWTLDRLAHEAGLSRTGLAVRFSQMIGMPPLRYLTTWRMQLACKALRETGLPLADVAEQVGYGSESGFARVFRKETGLPPATYRRKFAGLPEISI